MTRGRVSGLRPSPEVNDVNLSTVGECVRHGPGTQYGNHRRPTPTADVPVGAVGRPGQGRGGRTEDIVLPCRFR